MTSTGILSLWDGLSASVFRQATYSTARFGLYNVFAAQMRQYSGSSQLSTTSTILCAGLAGGTAGVIGNPTEVVLVRMCADGAKPAAERFGYSNPFSALYRIAREEGVHVFGRGLTANMARSVLMSMVTFRCSHYQKSKSDPSKRRFADCAIRSG
jgi:solute carrier family 25 (mitochondrial dicarboxylate transporter), member 10